jgi:PTH1 family peptidyl-tRNA hydrolase
VWLIVGLGNPGAKYAQNRHNIGFMVIDEIASRCRAESFRDKFGGQVAQAEFATQKVTLLKPMEYMNLSGHAVQRTSAFHKVEPKHVIVVHDEIDLPMGRLKLKVGGGHGGHNGIRSIVQELGSADFARVRCGVGRPGAPGGAGKAVADHVLSDFGKADKIEAEILIKEAADAVESMIKQGPQLAMNRFNTKQERD